MKNQDKEHIKSVLDGFVERYNNSSFIEDDPISIPHAFSGKEDREIAGFLASTIAWGNRKAILKSSRRMIELLDGVPYDFVRNASEQDINSIESFVHRTFNNSDFIYFIRSLQNIYTHHEGLGAVFENLYAQSGDMRIVLNKFWTLFFEPEHEKRVEKHLSSIAKGAACKRTNMYLRWMVRRDDKGVDFGLWDGIPASALYLPLDVHSATVGRAFGLLERKQNDWRSVEEITSQLREFDPSDPVKYDFALFGAGVNRADYLISE